MIKKKKDEGWYILAIPSTKETKEDDYFKIAYKLASVLNEMGLTAKECSTQKKIKEQKLINILSGDLKISKTILREVETKLNCVLID